MFGSAAAASRSKLSVAIAVSCSADRQAFAKCGRRNFLEQLEEDRRNIFDTSDAELSDEVIDINLNRPMNEIREELSKFPVKTGYLLRVLWS